jgi:sulfur transfer complex TusBCD TusB component (DsrH family)
MVAAENAMKIWINTMTEDCHTVVEFGAGKFDKLLACSSTVTKLIGIERFRNSVKEAPENIVAIHGDMRRFERFISIDDMNCALFCDSLEHLSRKDAFDLMDRVMSHFYKVLLIIPAGNHPQGKATDGNQYQAHLSTWMKEDVLALGFKDQHIDYDPKFHSAYQHTEKDQGCIFAHWRDNE